MQEVGPDGKYTVNKGRASAAGDDERTFGDVSQEEQPDSGQQ